ncbi:MAG: hypothetical protein ACJ8GN_02115 [Longimicrobiaceae bacterium]
MKLKHLRATISAILTENPVASVATGTVSAFIDGLHPNLFVGIALAYFPSTRHRPSSFGANLFKLFQWDANEQGELVQLSSTPVNGSSGQAAPDKWEGTTTLPMIELQHSYVGMGASDLGRWEVIVTLAPAIEMCEADFAALAQEVTIRAAKIVLP